MVIIEKRTERIKFWLTDKELKQIDRMDDIRKYFPREYTPVQMVECITKMLENNQRKEKHRTEDLYR